MGPQINNWGAPTPVVKTYFSCPFRKHAKYIFVTGGPQLIMWGPHIINWGPLHNYMGPHINNWGPHILSWAPHNLSWGPHIIMQRRPAISVGALQINELGPPCNKWAPVIYVPLPRWIIGGPHILSGASQLRKYISHVFSEPPYYYLWAPI